MSKKEFVMLCLRLLGIYFTVTGISSLSYAFSVFFDSSFSNAYLIVRPFIYIIVGAILYINAPKLSTYVIDFSEAEDDGFRITVDEKLARIAFIVLGFYIFAYAVPDLIQRSIEAGIFYQTMSNISQPVRWYEHRWFYVLPPLIELAIGAVLIIGSDKVVALLSHFDDTFKKMAPSNKGNPGDS